MRNEPRWGRGRWVFRGKFRASKSEDVERQGWARSRRWKGGDGEVFRTDSRSCSDGIGGGGVKRGRGCGWRRGGRIKLESRWWAGAATAVFILELAAGGGGGRERNEIRVGGCC